MVKKVNTCAVGGFVALRNLLLSPDCTSDILETLKCRACRELLESSSFSFDTLQLEVSKAPDKFSPTCTSANLAAETCPAPAPAPMESDPPKEDDEDPFAYAKKFAPAIQLLAPGSFSKAYPYVCTLCRTRRQPGHCVSRCFKMFQVS